MYVDDILISGSEKQIKEFIKELTKHYEVKDLEEISYYIDIKISRNGKGDFYLNQNNKIEEIVDKIHLNDAKPYSTPMDPGYLKLTSKENLLPNNHNYRQAIGALLYIATITRPDIMAATSILSQRNEKPRQADWNAVKRLISYLNKIKNLQQVIKSTHQPTLVDFSDADWGGDMSERKSRSGNILETYTKMRLLLTLQLYKSQLADSTTAEINCKPYRTH